MKENKIIIALDVNNLKELERLVDILSPYVGVFKVGMELFYSVGPKAIDIIRKYDRDVFLDLKLYDIPNTVRASARVITRLGIFMFNLHASGGSEMMKRAIEGAEEESEKLGIARPRILGVTVLTSMDQEILRDIGIENSPESEVLKLAGLAKKAGLDGVISSPKEISMLREKMGRNFLIVAPGVRPEGIDRGDQKRVATPKEAIDNGADYIVIGRPVTKAKNPLKAFEGIKLT